MFGIFQHKQTTKTDKHLHICIMQSLFTVHFRYATTAYYAVTQLAGYAYNHTLY